MTFDPNQYNLGPNFSLPACWNPTNQRALYVLPNWTRYLCFVLILLSDFVAFLCPDHNFGTSCHMTYANATRYLLLNLISRHFSSGVTWTSNTGSLVAPLIASDDEYARAE